MLGKGHNLASPEQVCRQHSPCANIKHICRHVEPVLRRSLLPVLYQNMLYNASVIIAFTGDDLGLRTNKLRKRALLNACLPTEQHNLPFRGSKLDRIWYKVGLKPVYVARIILTYTKAEGRAIRTHHSR